MPDFAPLTELELLAIQGPQVALRRSKPSQADRRPVSG